MANLPVSFDFAFEKVQCFPLYTYADYGRERRDNIPRTTLDRFINYYDDDKITSKDIFHYVYAVLHHPEYRKRDIAAAKRFFSRATRQHGVPRVITLDGYAASHRAVAKLKEVGTLPRRVRVRSCKYLNNVVEQDHRRIKQRIRADARIQAIRDGGRDDPRHSS